jgi:hypothetical protein
VLLDGKPMADGLVVFTPDVAKGNTSKFVPSGGIEDGEYTLATEGKPGAPPGWYKVTVSPGMPEMTADMKAPPKMLVLNPRYGSVANTPFSVEVVSGGTQYDLKLDRYDPPPEKHDSKDKHKPDKNPKPPIP